MTSIVIQLQQDAMDRNTSVADLLRRALAVAGKLGVVDFERWILCELEGYPEDTGLPAYRTVEGQVRAMNPVRGWIPVMFQSTEDEQKLSRVPCRSTVAELEQLISGAGLLCMPFPADIERQISEGSTHRRMAIALHVNKAVLVGILDTVRNAVLKWALQLEKDGIVGEAVSFSSTEKSAASSHTYYVNNFMAPLTSAQISQNSSGATQVNQGGQLDGAELMALVSAIRIQAEALALAKHDAEELRAELATVESQAASPRPKHTIIRESLLSIRRILESAAGSATGLLIQQIAQLLS